MKQQQRVASKINQFHTFVLMFYESAAVYHFECAFVNYSCFSDFFDEATKKTNWQRLGK